MFPPKYDFHLTENGEKTKKYWKKIIEKNSKNFQTTLLLPPPNITGNLHLGHALDSVTQDFLVRFSYLNKRPIYWIAGIDHAGISTQSKIENLKITKLDSNEKKKQYTFEIWYPQSRKIFCQQWEKLGLLIDHGQAIFTLDENVQKQVRKAFIKLYNDGLIYRGTKIVNWDPKLKSVVSDIEVENKQSKSKLYYLKYPLESSNKNLLVATSRPETIFGDVALFVNPQDRRYQKYIGKKVKHPITQKIIPILTDDSIKIDFGSGVLKCTPGHDLKDYNLAKKHQLPIVSCCDEKGILNQISEHWQGQEINGIREELINQLLAKGICEKIEDYETNLDYSERSGALIEPILSQQWFLDLPSLIKEVEKKQPNFLKQTEFIPPQFQKILEKWRDKAQEWCLSRQLWWGHQIPAWYHQKTGEIYVGEENPNKCYCLEHSKKHLNIRLDHNCSLHEWKPEKDVLDTWFSSGLWPIVTLDKKGENFPNQIPNCYPITTLVTGYDILFFWVLKMMLLGTYFTNKVPFQQILLHGLIRDEKGRKMSKSLGNGVEPDLLIEKYGCDSLRLFLLENNIWGSDLVYQEEKVIGSWRFCQKIWSVANLIKSKLPTEKLRKIKKEDLEQNDNLINQWILNKLNILKEDYFKHLEKNKWEINLITGKLVKFTREDLSSIYLELIKISPWDKNTLNNLLYIYQQLLVMFHPIIPFITDYIYQNITQKKILETEIEVLSIKDESHKIWQVDCLIVLINNIRNLRKKSNIDKFCLELMPEWQKKLEKSFDFNSFLEPLTKIRISLLKKESRDNFTSFVDLKPFGILWYQEQNRDKDLKKKLKFYQEEFQRSKKILENINFIKKAPSQLVEEEKDKLKYYEEQQKKITEELEKFKNK